jgi:hypothetical protein
LSTNLPFGIEAYDDLTNLDSIERRLAPALSRHCSRLWRDAGQKPGGRLKA